MIEMGSELNRLIGIFLSCVFFKLFETYFHYNNPHHQSPSPPIFHMSLLRVWYSRLHLLEDIQNIYVIGQYCNYIAQNYFKIKSADETN